MFLFSKKLLYLLVIVALVFGEDTPPQKGAIQKCLLCGDARSYLCDGKNEVPNDICDGTNAACGVKKDGDKIFKLCGLKQEDWDDGKGKPKNIHGVECWCRENNCNAEPGFCGIIEGGSKGNSTGGNGTGGGVAPIPGDSLSSGGAVATIISPGLVVLFWLVTSVARFP